MDSLPQTLILLAVIAVFAYWRARMATILGTIVVALIAMTWYDGIAWLPWLTLLVVAFFYFAADLRIDRLTRPAFRLFKDYLPPISDTELEALEAGDVWWDAELFKGDPDWKELLGYARPELTYVEQTFLDNETARLCELLDEWEIVHERHDLPREAWDFIKQAGFFGMIIPKEYGGLGFSALAHSSVIAKIASKSVSAAVTVMVPNSLGPAELLLKYGTVEQRNRWLPGLARGEEIPCFALTSVDAGSDAGSLTDTGVVRHGVFEGQECIGLSLTWSKRYITLAPVATVLGLAFRMLDPDHLLGDTEDLGITVALIPTNHPGVITGQRHFPMGQAFLNGPTEGQDVFVPLDWIIGGADFAGKGWQMLMNCLSEGRGISLPALATANAKMCYRMTGAYSKIRKQFNLAIGNFEGVEEALARIAGHTYLLEAARLMTAGAVDQGIRPSVISAIAKYHMTERSRRVIQDAMDVHGGRGLIMGPANYLAHMFVSSPISITVEGANILTRNLIIFGQGAIRCHPFIFREMQAGRSADEKSALREFDSLIFRHIGYGISNVVRSLALGITSARFVRRPVRDATGSYYQHLTRMSSALALVSDISMLLLGGGLKRKERLSARLGDVLSELYLASTVLKYYQDHGHHEDDLPHVVWNLKLALYNCQTALTEFFHNLPNRPVAILLRWIIFPWGARYRLPDDALEHAIVQCMFSDNELRHRITSGTHMGMDPRDPTFSVEDAFRRVNATKDTRLKIREAMKAGRIGAGDPAAQAADAIDAGLCSSDEGASYVEAEAARRRALQVDSFPAGYFGPLSATSAADVRESDQ